jgi:hypothetical protein
MMYRNNRRKSRVSYCNCSCTTTMLWMTLLQLLVVLLPTSSTVTIDAATTSSSSSSVSRGTIARWSATANLQQTTSSLPPLQQQRLPLLWSTLRGGSAATAIATDPKQVLHAYRLQQQLYLNSRSLQLRQALIGRGLVELQHTAATTVEGGGKVVTDWDCAVSTAQHPKSCLYSLDAEQGAKVMAPAVIATTTSSANAPQQQHQWITVSALNRLRRNDPTKVEPLWHNQYHILSTWFSQTHPFSVNTHLSAVGTLLSYLLDTPAVLTAMLSLAAVLLLLVTLPVWEAVSRALLTSGMLWQYWPSWGRFVHAAMPLKLLLGQMAFKFLQNIFVSAYHSIRSQCVEWECTILEQCLPVTILEDDGDDNGNAEVQALVESINDEGEEEE